MATFASFDIAEAAIPGYATAASGGAYRLLNQKLWSWNPNSSRPEPKNYVELEPEVSRNRTSGQGGVVINNSWQATKHYLFGDGSPARIGTNTIRSLLSSPEFIKAHRMIINGQTKSSGEFSVDMTSRVFHIGRTNVSYSIAPGGHSVTYKLFIDDGFWDPDFIDEQYLGSRSPYFRPDRKGPNLERFGGTPYDYIPTIMTFSF